MGGSLFVAAIAVFMALDFVVGHLVFSNLSRSERLSWALKWGIIPEHVKESGLFPMYVLPLVVCREFQMDSSGEKMLNSRGTASKTRLKLYVR